VNKSIDQLCVDTIRMLAVDMVERANSGHPGMPLGAAPMAYVLWDRFLMHNPGNPSWPDRDRFVLSAGHGSALLYALLHLYGYDVSIDDLREFRQWNSKTPGHPERGLAPGVETTTGPLGQGFAMGVGMALAEAHLSAVFDADVVDHHTYAIVSDGDLMEGVASEAASLAGTMGLGKLVYLYDDNKITIEGPTSLAFTEDVDGRFGAYGWQVLKVEDGNDLDAIEAAIAEARADERRPSLIRISTHIGFGSPRQDSEKAHGEPLGSEGAAATRDRFGWGGEAPFHVPEPVRDYCSAAVQRGSVLEKEWHDRLDVYRRSEPRKAALFETLAGGGLPDGWDAGVPSFGVGDGPLATRAASGKVLNALASGLPTLLGGSADLAPSNKTLIAGATDFGFDHPAGRNIHFGVREHAMAAIVNGMALHGSVFPYGGTFLVFSDYMRPSLRLAALMQTRSIFVFTHDSIGVGEDGPTHQPVEQLASLRAIPGFTVLRPADANETAAVWRLAVGRGGPCALALSRQKLPVLEASADAVERGVSRGAYVLVEPAGNPDLVVVATGSEVHLAVAAASRLAGRGVTTRVVSMPSRELFCEQEPDYRSGVLPPEIPKLAVEAGVTMGWREIVGDGGAVIGLDRFGHSAPGATVMDKLGFNVDNVVDHAMRLLGRRAQ
jgi:transketolase